MNVEDALLHYVGMVDSTGGVVEIQLSADHKTVWVNVDGLCRFRACEIKTFRLRDLGDSDGE